MSELSRNIPPHIQGAVMVIRVNKSRDYTVINNTCFRDKRLSLKAKGLLSEMLSLPDDWDYTVEGLVAINKENKTAIESALAELKECGYLVVTKLMPNQTKTGRIEYQYDIYEQPQGKQEVEKQGVENLGVEFLGVENQTQYITNKQSTKEKVLKSNIFHRPTVEEVKAYCIERGNNVDADTFVAYYESNGWMVGKKKMKDWKAAVRYWESTRKKKKEKSFEEMAAELEREMDDTSRYF